MKLSLTPHSGTTAHQSGLCDTPTHPPLPAHLMSLTLGCSHTIYRLSRPGGTLGAFCALSFHPHNSYAESLCILSFLMRTTEAQRLRNLLEGNIVWGSEAWSQARVCQKTPLGIYVAPGSSRPSDTGSPSAPTPDSGAASSWHALALPPSLSRPPSSFKSHFGWDTPQPSELAGYSSWKRLWCSPSPDLFAPSPLPDRTVLPLLLLGSLAQAKRLLSGNSPLENEPYQVLHKNEFFLFILFLWTSWRLWLACGRS